MKIKGNLYNLGKFEESKNYFEAEIELSVEDLAKQLSDDDKKVLCKYATNMYYDPTEPEKDTRCVEDVKLFRKLKENMETSEPPKRISKEFAEQLIKLIRESNE